MKKSELKQLIKEQIRSILKEESYEVSEIVQDICARHPAFKKWLPEEAKDLNSIEELRDLLGHYGYAKEIEYYQDNLKESTK